MEERHGLSDNSVTISGYYKGSQGDTTVSEAYETH